MQTLYVVVASLRQPIEPLSSLICPFLWPAAPSGLYRPNKTRGHTQGKLSSADRTFASPERDIAYTFSQHTPKEPHHPLFGSTLGFRLSTTQRARCWPEVSCRRHPFLLFCYYRRGCSCLSLSSLSTLNVSRPRVPLPAESPLWTSGYLAMCTRGQGAAFQPYRLISK